MSSLKPLESRKFEELLGMSSGYVPDFSDRTFGDFFLDVAEIDIHSQKYQAQGSSKAKKLRAFWRLESDSLVGKALLALIDRGAEPADDDKRTLADQCRRIANRLLAGGPDLRPLKAVAAQFDANYLAQQVQRMEEAVEKDPPLAIGTAKELVETCCKTILAERAKPIAGNPDIPTLTKAALKELGLVPEGVPDSARGKDIIRRLLSNLGTIGNNLAELRGLYGTGHGSHAKASGLSPRHARLAVGAATTLAVFLFETHKETAPHRVGNSDALLPKLLSGELRMSQGREAPK